MNCVKNINFKQGWNRKGNSSWLKYLTDQSIKFIHTLNVHDSIMLAKNEIKFHETSEEEHAVHILYLLIIYGKSLYILWNLLQIGWQRQLIKLL